MYEFIQNSLRWLVSRTIAVRLAVLSVIVPAASGCGNSEALQVQLSGPTMGTTYRVVAYDVEDRKEELTDAIDAELARINKLMSTYISDSEVSRFNDHDSTDWFPVSMETVHVIEAALAVSRKSEGAFDITVGPLIELWGFGSKGRRASPPTSEDIEAVRQHVGYSKLAVRRSPPALRKSSEKLRIDLSAIAKGYAVDRVVEVVKTFGSSNFLVEVGGEVYASGEKPSGQKWNLGIESPQPEVRQIFTTARLKDKALATSGDYRNFFEHEGRRYSHTIDPRTSEPVTHSLTSISVTAANCTEADAWATALLVVGPDKLNQLAAANGLETLAVQYEGENVVVSRSERFPKPEQPDDSKLGDPKKESTAASSTPIVFIATFAAFAIAIVGMAVGVIVSNRKLAGSCGGLNADGEQSPCSMCTVPAEQCREKEKWLAQASEES